MSVINRAVDQIHEAVQEAIAAGMEPKDFIRNAWASWEQELEDQKIHIAAIFKKALE